MDYKAKKCKENGTQLTDNLTKAQRRGQAKLKKRQDNGEIVISQTDKSGINTVSKRDIYKQMGAVHTAKDKIITWKEYKGIKQNVLDHTGALNNVFQIGKEHGEANETRCRNACMENSSVIPDIIFRQKDHKPVSKDGLPKTRPLCLASCTCQQRISEYLCTITKATFSAEDTPSEAISTEDMLSAVDSLNDQIRKGEVDDERIMIGSLDVEALFPSTDTKIAAKLTRDKVRDANITYDGIDWRWAVVYLALTMTAIEKVDAKVQGLIPRRLVPKNNPPTIKTWEVDCKRERWWYPKPPGFLTQEDKNLIMGCIAEQLVKVVFGSHVYFWEGNIYHQQGGAPMGLDSSTPISRILMDKWLQEIKEIQTKTEIMSAINPVAYEEISIKLIRKYVDDILAGLYKFKLGTRWDPKQQLMVWSPEAQQEDTRNKCGQEEVTMREFSAMASSVMKCLNFTYDYPGPHNDYRMPVLDTAMWTSKEQRQMGVPKPITTTSKDKLGSLKIVIMHTFYRKPVANNTPLARANAIPEKTLVQIAANEYLRRYRNTSRDLPPTEIEDVIRKYSEDLLRGGFTRDWIKQALKAATIGYSRMIDRYAAGEAPINKPEKST